MKHLKTTFRHWWQPPRKASETEENRSVSFLELFYDLVYVVIIAELTHTLVGVKLTGELLLGFIGLFAIVWFAWINGTYYHETHGNNDIRSRIFTFLQMFPLAGMAIFIHSALGEGYQGFALFYAGFLVILTYLWWRTGVYDPNHKIMSQPFSIAFCGTTAAFAISAFLPTPVAFYVWSGAILFSLALPLILQATHAHKMDSKELEATQRIAPSLVERFGLFTIIILGEVVVSVVRGSELEHHFSSETLLNTLLALGIVIGMWWLYFDYISHRLPIQNTITRFAWMYLHLPLGLSASLTAAGVMNTLHDHTVSFLVFVGLSMFLLCTAALTYTIQFRLHKSGYCTGAFLAILSAISLTLFGIFGKPDVMTALSMDFIGVILPVLFGFYVWTKNLTTIQPYANSR